MAIIDPDGLFSGDRLAACSDIAQLYWPRLFIAANSCARLELSYTSIISKIFKNFRKPPKADELWAIFEEYDKNYLAVLYEVNGTWWCQFVTSEKYLPKYKRTRDSLTPAPTPEALDVYRFGYLEWKKTNSFSSNTFRNVSKVSDGKGREGVGVGIGIGVGAEKATPPSAALPDWIPTESWQAFVEMRKKIRAPLTSRAITLTINALEKLRANGNDPGAVLDQSVQADYRGVFELKTGGKSGKSGADHQGAAVGRVKRTGSAWDAAIDKRLASANGHHAEADVSSVPTSGVRGGDDRDVSADLRGPGGGVRPAEPGDGPAKVSEPATVLPPSQRSTRGA